MLSDTAHSVQLEKQLEINKLQLIEARKTI
jgi:hypothetical protein